MPAHSCPLPGRGQAITHDWIAMYRSALVPIQAAVANGHSAIVNYRLRPLPESLASVRMTAILKVSLDARRTAKAEHIFWLFLDAVWVVAVVVVVVVVLVWHFRWRCSWGWSGWWGGGGGGVGSGGAGAGVGEGGGAGGGAGAASAVAGAGAGGAGTCAAAAGAAAGAADLVWGGVTATCRIATPVAGYRHQTAHSYYCSHRSPEHPWARGHRTPCHPRSGT